MMKLRVTLSVLTAVAIMGFGVRSAAACGGYMDEELRELVDTAIGGTVADAKDAVEILRSRKLEGVYALSSYEHEAAFHLKRARANEKVGAADIATLQARHDRIRAALDKVAGQKDAHVSRLYWHTDFEDAKAEAKKRKLPILSLRLLGRLDEDLSCANSRYFRSVLYADSRVHHHLRQHYVLHWKSIRPVPVMTIDFGDGRRICRTVTGNSVHYILDAEGRPIDALPGLYSAKAFKHGLVKAGSLERSLRGKTADARALRLAVWHAAEGSRLDRAFLGDLEAIGDPRGAALRKAELARGVRSTAVENSPAPSARRAAPIALGKSMVEAPAVRAIQPDVMDVIADAKLSTYESIAALPAHADEFGAGALRLMRSKVATKDDKAFTKMARLFRRAVLIDSVRNEYDLHRQIHAWFSRSEVKDVDAFNERVYADLFLTPSSDPWLGLVPKGAYAALDGGGFVASDVEPSVAHPIASR